MANCSIEEKNRLITRYANIFKSSGMPVEEAKQLANERFNTLGSSTQAIDNTGVTPEVLNADNVQEIFDRLTRFQQTNPIDSPAHLDTLRRALNGSLSALNKIGNASLYTVLNQGPTRGSITDKDILLNVDTHINNSPLPMSPNEVLVHEIEHLITKAALEDKDNYLVVSEIERLWKEARLHLTNTYGKNKEYLAFIDFDENITPDPEEVRVAKERYDYIFGTGATSTIEVEDRYGQKYNKTIPTNLHEFIAFGRSNEKLINALKGFTFKTPTKEINSFEDRIANIYFKVLDWFVGMFNKSRGKRGDVALNNLVKELTKTIEKNKFSTERLMKVIDNIERFQTDWLDEKVWEPLEKWNFTKTDKNRQDVLGIALGIINPRTRDSYMKVFNGIRRNKYIGARTFAYELAEEASTGPSRKLEEMTYRSKAILDRAVEKEREVLSKNIKEAYITDVSKTESEALTKSLLMTDLSALGTNIEYMRDMLINPNNEIGRLTKSLTGTTEIKNHFLNQARSLGHRMAKGTDMIYNTMPNATAIAHGRGDRSLEIPPNVTQENEETINKLATLFAIQYTSKSARTLAVKVIEREQNKSFNSNGISFTLDLHTDFKRITLEETFENNPMQSSKGFIEELFNPSIDIQTASTKKERDALKKAGYVLENEVKTSIHDNYSKKIYLYKSKYGGLNTWNKAIFSITNTTHKGADIISRGGTDNSINSYAQGYATFNTMKNRFSRQALTYRDKKYHEEKDVIPRAILDPNGNIVNYSYTMTQANKEKVLEQSMVLHDTLSAMYARHKNKLNTKVINNEVLDYLQEDFQKNFTTNSRDFVFISNDSNDEELRTIYRLLPSSVRVQLKDRFGKKGIYIRNNEVRHIFGYRDKSIANNKYLNYQAVRLAEKIIKEVISIARTSIVIRTITVLRDNIISNTFYLLVAGVPIEKIFSLQMKGLKGIQDFIKNESMIRELELKLTNKSLSKSEISSINAEIANIRKLIETNPIYPLIQANLFQTIAEEVDPDREDFSVLGRFYDSLKPTNSKVFSGAETIGKQLYMAKDTMSFNVLLKSTQYSDFIARFAIYEYRVQEIRNNTNLLDTEKKKKEKELLEQIKDMFINYEMMTNPYIKYANDIGLAIFTKYPLRITRSLFHLFYNRNSTITLFLFFQYILGLDIPDPTDSTILNKDWFSNPINVGAEAFHFHGLEGITAITS